MKLPTLALFACATFAIAPRLTPGDAQTDFEIVAVYPGECIEVQVTFEAANENAISVKDHNTGRELQNFNNYFGGGGVWVSPRNMTGSVVLYRIEGWHKITPPEGDEPWYPSQSRVLERSEYATAIGFEDWEDADYNDAVATVIKK